MQETESFFLWLIFCFNVNKVSVKSAICAFEICAFIDNPKLKFKFNEERRHLDYWDDHLNLILYTHN